MSNTIKDTEAKFDNNNTGHAADAAKTSGNGPPLTLDGDQPMPLKVCAGEHNYFECQCSSCTTPIHVHPGPPFWMHDLLIGGRYLSEVLPRNREGNRVLLCKWCTDDAQTIIRAGYTFDEHILREAKERKLEVLLPPHEREEIRQQIIDRTRNSVRLVGSDAGEPAPVAPVAQLSTRAEDHRQLEEYERAVLIECYREVEQVVTAQVAEGAEEVLS